jgi:hypothetical protein
LLHCDSSLIDNGLDVLPCPNWTRDLPRQKVECTSPPIRRALVITSK